MLVNGISPGIPDGEKLIRYGTLAEEQGLESIWVGESWGPAAVPRHTQLLERTDRIDVCSGIFNVFTRTPALIAMTANTLAEISDGRFRIGLGTSGPDIIRDFHGVEFDKPLRRSREYMEIIRSFLAGERVEYHGEIFELSGFAIDMDEFHDTPIYLAALGEVNRQLTGEFADGWIPLLIPNTKFESALEPIKRGARRANRSIDDIDITPWVPTCISRDNPAAAKDHVRSLLGFYIGAMGDYYAKSVSSFGFEDEVEKIQARWAENRNRGAAKGVTDGMVTAFGAAGTPEEAAESFGRFTDTGADSPVAYIPSRWASDEMIQETITHL